MKRTKKATNGQLIRPTTGASDMLAATGPTESILELVATHHVNATRCQTARVVIDFPPMREVMRACSSIFAEIDREDPLQRAISRDVWLVKSSLMLTALHSMIRA